VFRLETGRTHQIRVHMAYLGCPLAGDDLYGAEKTDAFPRQALHCAALGFAAPQGEELRLYSPFPPQLLAAAGLESAQPLLQQVCEEFLR
jgi:23S rRNA pseudouridine1911/1915/1917 synthase